MYPLTSFQKQIFAICHQYPGSCAYNIPAAIDINGDINYDSLLKSLEYVQDWHPELRTIIIEKDGEFFQLLGDRLKIEKQIAEPEELEDKLSMEAAKPIGCMNNALARIIVWSSGERRCVIQLTISHIIGDRASLSILINSLWKIYNLLISECTINTPTTLSFFDYLSEETRLSHHYTSNSYFEGLENMTSASYIPLDYEKNNSMSFMGDSATNSIQGHDYDKIKSCSKDHKTTPYVFFASAVASMLYKMTGYDDIVLASAVSTRSLKFLETSGPILNTVLLRQQFSDDILSYQDLLISMNDKTQDMLHYSFIPFSDILSGLRHKGQLVGETAFQCMYVYNGSDFDFLENDSLSMQLFLVNNHSTKCDLTIYLVDNGKKFNIRFEYSNKIFKPETIKILLDNLILLSKKIASNSSLSIRSQINDYSNSIIRNYESGKTVDFATNVTLLDKFIENFATLSSKEAVIYKGHSYTYKDLSTISDNVAFNLSKKGVNKGDIIGVYSERTHELIPILIGIWKMGGVYLPLECSSPEIRLNDIIDIASPKLILINTEYKVKEVIKNKGCISFKDVVLPHTNSTSGFLSDPPTPSDNAYMIFTSGSTGKPKGVLINHLGIYNRISWMHHNLDITSSDNILQKTSLMFDVSLWELLLPFFSGCKLAIAESNKSSDPQYLAQIMQDKSISIVHFVPVYLDAAVDVFNKYSFDYLRHIICSGDILKKSTINNTYAFLPSKTTIHNYYGPTEASIDVSYYSCPRVNSERLTPIGEPIWNTQLYLVKDNEIVNDILTPGALYIAGVGLATEYCNTPLLTTEKFAPLRLTSGKMIRAYSTGDIGMWSSDGKLQFLGRNDRQIKIRGIRIEAGDIESRLESNNKIASSYVCKQDSIDNSENLIAYVVLKEEMSVTDEELKSFLSSYFIPSAVPNKFIYLDKFPLMPSGKVDTKALKQLETKSINLLKSEKIDKDDGSYIILREIWQKVLSCNEISINDNYFNLGGDSIKSIRIVAQAKEHGFTFGISDLLNNPTIQSLIRFRRSQEQRIDNDCDYKEFELIKSSDKQITEISDIEDAFPLSMLQQALIYHSEVSEHYNVYVTTFRIKGKFDLELWQKAIQLTSDTQSIMRSFFEIGTYSEPLQVILKNVVQKCDYKDLRAQKNQDILLAEFFELEKTNVFDWGQAPLLRYYIHHLDKNLFQFTVSEPCLDGWSVSIICTEILKNYEALLNKNIDSSSSERASIDILDSNKQVKPSLGAFIKQEQQVLQSAEHLGYWRNALLHSEKTIIIPDKSVHKQPFRIEHYVSHMDTDKLLQLAQVNNLPFKSVLLALHCKLLAFITQQDIVTTGIMSNARPEKSGWDEIAGMFINVLPITVEVKNNSIAEIAQKLIKIEAAANTYRYLPYASIIKHSTDQIFDSVFNFTNFYPYKDFVNNKNIEIQYLKGSDQTLFGVTMQFTLLPVEKNLRVAFDFNHLEPSDSIVNKIHDTLVDIMKYENEAYMSNSIPYS